jgi:hypothetical protein
MVFSRKTLRLAIVFGVLLFLTPVLELGWDVPAGSARSKPALASGTAPVLLVYNDSYTSNKFGRFLGEIMQTEGFNLYDTTQLSGVSLALLNNYDTVVLAETSLTSGQASAFSQYVQAGGNLIAMRPDAQLASVFGLGSSAGTISNAYVAIQTGNAYGQGLAPDSLQTHVTATKYNVTTAQKIALLYSNATTATSYPAVTVNSFGSGKAVAFTYDLASAVIYLRQGNPAQTDVDSDGDGIVRIVDMYYHWIDLNKMPLPQADIQQRFFGRILSLLNAAKKPLPRFWYFPNAQNTTIVLTSDAHANPDSYYQTVIDGMQQYGYNTTFYMAQAANPLPANLPGWESLGFTFSIHPYETTTSLSVGYNNVDDWFTMQYGTRTSRTTRIHQLQWQGWVDAAKIGVTYNMAMDFTPYRYGNWIKYPDNTWVPGYMTGSGLPMKFIDQNGQIVNNFGQYTEVADDQILYTGPENLSQTDAFQYTKNAIDASEAGNNEAIAFQMHVDDFGGESVWTESTLNYIHSLNLPVYNGDSWLAFTENRYNSTFSNLTWNNNQLGFSVNIPASQSGQTIILPAMAGSSNISTIKVNGNFVSYSTRVVRGENFAFLTLPGGVSNIVATYDLGADCNPLLVNNTNDTMPSGSCDTTLRKALLNASTSGGTVSLNHGRLSGTPVVITLTSPLTIPANVTIQGVDGSCSSGAPGLRLITSGTNAVQLAGGNTLTEIEIQSSGGGSKPGLKTSGPGNKLRCTSIKSGP